MNEITIFIWIAIALIAIISIIIVKFYYNGKEDEKDSEIDIISEETLNEKLPIDKEKNDEAKNKNISLSPQTPKENVIFKKRTNTPPKNDGYIVPEVEKNNLTNYDYESQNKVLINYDNKIKKFQEPIKESQMDIMTQNIRKKEETELKDLFTIDELIKESKRKDSQRERESRKIKKDIEEDKELDDIKESIKNKTEEPLIEEIKEDEIDDLLKDNPKEVQSVLTQEDVDRAISEASQKNEEKPVADDDITNMLLNEEKKQAEIKQPTLKTPSKIKTDDEAIAIPIDDSNLNTEEEPMDLDYRKDIDKFTNKIKGSKLYQEVKDKFTSDTVEEFPEDDSDIYIRNVKEYDDYEPIVNETHVEYEAKYGIPEANEEERLRQENTKKIFDIVKESSSEPVNPFENKSTKDSIKITLNNNDVILKKGDEIIFNHLGETYSSQVYSISGDNISVRYRRKNITIKPKDVKKIY